MTNQDAPVTRQDAPTTPHRFVPVAEAARILGLSPTTIRRRIDAGELEAERVVRPQGTAFLVKVPDAPPRADEAPGTPQDAPGTHHQEPAGTDGLAAILLPLVAEQAALRQTVERQAERLEAQAETIGRQGAELERAASTVVALSDELAAAESSRRREHRRLSLALAVAGALAVAAGTAPAWVR